MSDVLPRPTTAPDLTDQVRALSDAASTPSLVALSYALRHPETWPEGFKWNYDDCASCAIGLSSKLWSSLADVPFQDRPITNGMAPAFLMNESDALSIFDFLHHKVCPGDSRRNVTPTHVADAIDAHLAATVTP